MKKIILITIILLSIGCTNKKEQLLEQYGKDYYEKHMKMTKNINLVTITLSDLKNVSEQNGYNLKKLEKCKSSTKITLYLDENKNVKNHEIELDC